MKKETLTLVGAIVQPLSSDYDDWEIVRQPWESDDEYFERIKEMGFAEETKEQREERIKEG